MRQNNVTRRIRGASRVMALTSTTAGGLSGGYLLVLLGAAVWNRRSASPEPRKDLMFAVVIPAHDEESQVGAAVASVQACDYPAVNRRIVVVADNCMDRTAEAARAAGADVWERIDDVRQGKGHALAWAFCRLMEDASIDAVCVIDADCDVSPNLLGALAVRVSAGAQVVQAPYLVSDPDASASSALRWAGFALFNVVRPLGRHQLGLSCGLSGTGMAISRELLIRSPWRAFSYAEDREQHMRWVLRGARVAFAWEAEVRSPAAHNQVASRAQEARWESGRIRLAIRLTPRLIGRSFRIRDAAALDAAIEPLLPPQSLLLGINLIAIAASRLARARIVLRLAVFSSLAQFAYVVGGLVAVSAPASVWRALLSVPRFLVRRAVVFYGAAMGRGPSEWQRTTRRPDPDLT